MSFIDGNLLAKAKEGDRESITEFCEYLAQCFRAKTAADPWAMELLCDALEKIGRGQSPDAAFCWTQSRKGRRNENTANQEWDVKMTVRDRMRSGETWRTACHAVSSDAVGEFLLSQKTIEKICAGLTAETELPMPDDIFPLGKKPEMYRRRDRRNG